MLRQDVAFKRVSKLTLKFFFEIGPQHACLATAKAANVAAKGFLPVEMPLKAVGITCPTPDRTP